MLYEFRRMIVSISLFVFMSLFAQVFMDIRAAYLSRLELQAMIQNSVLLESNRYQSVDLSTNLEEYKKYVDASETTFTANYSQYLTAVNNSGFLNPAVFDYISDIGNVKLGMLPIDVGLAYLDIEQIQPLVEQDLEDLIELNSQITPMGIELVSVQLVPNGNLISVQPFNSDVKDRFWGSNHIDAVAQDLYDNEFYVSINYTAIVTYTYNFRTSVIYGTQTQQEIRKDFEYNLIY